MSNSDWLTIPAEEIWEVIVDRVVETTKETYNNININDDVVVSALENMIDNGTIDGHIESKVESYFENNIDQHIHDTIEYSYELLDGDDVIGIIHNQWGEGEYDQVVKEILAEYSAVDMKEVEKLIDARHEEDTATSTELYEQVQDLTKKVDQMQKTISVIVSSMAHVGAFAHQSE